MSTPPTKPPRGIKHPKETSGLLMSVIRTLSASESNEQRDREKAKLEREYKKSDQRLDELVSLHDQDLTQVMQLFAKLSARVTLSREKIHAVKENLQACKMLLHCRRDELKKLWLEGVEHKHVLQLLEEIDQLREVPAKLTSFLNKKHYLHATQLLVSALTLGEGGLEGVEALREVRADLQSKKQQLHMKLMEELSHHIYTHSTQEVLSLCRQGSGRENLLNSPFQRAGELRNSARNPKARRALLDVSSPLPNCQSTRTGLSAALGQPTEGDVSEDIDAVDPEADSEHFMAILVECLALLNKLPDAVEYIFEGLGHLIAKILITSAQYIERIDEGGIQKMCRNIFALQQTLTNITMAREIALDHARHYFELFYLTPEEILNNVMEKGPQFSELEYMNAFQLIHRSMPDADYGAINIHLSRLSDILGEVGVTV
ncbi:Exocyst complex component 4 [Gryllus bimaculatus]|nr:Exocyst complex component 4 [Gryllus bimaculatus]